MVMGVLLGVGIVGAWAAAWATGARDARGWASRSGAVVVSGVSLDVICGQVVVRNGAA
jgi:hypothetical protein